MKHYRLPCRIHKTCLFTKNQVDWSEFAISTLLFLFLRHGMFRNFGYLSALKNCTFTMHGVVRSFVVEKSTPALIMATSFINTLSTDSKTNSDLKHNIPYKGPTNRKKNHVRRSWTLLFYFIQTLKILFRLSMYIVILVFINSYIQ